MPLQPDLNPSRHRPTPNPSLAREGDATQREGGVPKTTFVTP